MSSRRKRCAAQNGGCDLRRHTARKPQGYAHVQLTIENADGALPYDSAEVSVSRRLYRSGESEYRINGTSVRLRDVHELFMDTGLGRDGYSIIGQGRIAEIVSAKSTQRREIFEEAAGISKYRYRRQERSAAWRPLRKTFCACATSWRSLKRASALCRRRRKRRAGF